MLAFLADATSDATSIVYPVGGGVVLIFLTMLKMVWSASKNEAAVRKMFADEREAREREFTADYAKQKQDYSDSLIRHQQIHAAEIAAFQERITNYIEELTTTKGRVTVLEAEVKDLKSR